MKYPISFGKYLLLERINVGGMAEVFKAKTFGVEGFERILAVKRILPNMADDEEFINMFVDEARISVQLSHANIVQIYELGKYEGTYYIAMEYVPGKDLRQLLDRLRKRNELLPIPAVAFVVSKLCDGLDYAHRKTDPSGRPMRVIHRDVSPQNVLLSYEGAVKVTDFGIAKAEDRASKTQAGVLKGKFGYMSPEQVRGMEIDRRSDVFAVGILLYEMVTGKRLFLGESDFSTLEKVRNAEVTPPREINPDIPEELERLMLRTLARERDDRYQWASELQDDLQQFLIEGNTIFTAKRLAEFLRQEYADEMIAEAAKMEEFMSIKPPDDMLDAAANHAALGPHGNPEWHAGQDNPAAKTMIFDAGGAFTDAATEIAQGASDDESDGDLDAEGHRTRTRTRTHHTGSTSVQVRPSSAVGVVARRTTGRTPTGAVKANGDRKHVVAIALAAIGFLALLAMVLLYVFVPSGATGSIVVMISPVTEADVFLDERLITNSTPHTEPDVPFGQHNLVVKAAGFVTTTIPFELNSDKALVFPVNLEREGADGQGGPPSDLPAGDATLTIETDPPGASVRVAGLPRGTTPLPLSNIDPGRTIVIELQKDGYRGDSVPVTFSPDEAKAKAKTVRVKMIADPNSGRASISLESEPSNAFVTINDKSNGATPIKIDNLDPTATYEIVVFKPGYERWTKTVTFNGRIHKAFKATLDKAGKNPPAKSKASKGKGKEKEKEKDKPAKAKSKESGGGGGGGGGGACAGSGAKLSVMALGAQGCKITLGGKAIGETPLFKKSVQVGSCTVKLVCEQGKTYTTTLNLKNGDAEKLIVKPEMWQQQ